MEHQTLLKRVMDYFERTRSEPGLGEYKPDEVGHWKIITGTDRTGLNRKEFSIILHGEFRDAVAYAVQQKEFYSSLRGVKEEALSSEHGIVKKSEGVMNLLSYGIPKSLLQDFRKTEED